jgi:hypothetical protein
VFRHVVLVKLQEGATAAQREAILDGLAALPGQVPSIRSYRFGYDAGLAEGNHDLAIVADFDDRAGYELYRDHPGHQAFIRDHLRPVLAGRAAVQHEA